MITLAAGRVARRHAASALRAAALSLTLFGAAQAAAAAEAWSCHGAKPGHPTADERALFVREASELALRAEKKYGVPAAALAAIAIAESTYGWTRPALEANNLFAWKASRALVKEGKAFVPPCDRRRIRRTGYQVFHSRAQGFDHVASRLAAMAAYRRHTDEYRAKRSAGKVSPAAVDAWLSGIARRYSGEPQPFITKLKRIMNDPIEPSDTLSAERNLYRLSAHVAIHALE
jgi:Mannosyl-glycoprotein endo-beta-N-acetylglucosaminidase